MADENKWNFDDDEARKAAIEAEAEYRFKGAKAAVKNAAREAEAGPNALARIAEADADARAREAEARYGWIDGMQRLVRTCVIGAALFASFYWTPDFWPSVTHTVSEVIRIALAHPKG